MSVIVVGHLSGTEERLELRVVAQLVLLLEEVPHAGHIVHVLALSRAAQRDAPTHGVALLVGEAGLVVPRVRQLAQCTHGGRGLRRGHAGGAGGGGQRRRGGAGCGGGRRGRA